MQLLADLGADATSYAHEIGACDAAYYYRVTAYAGDRESPPAMLPSVACTAPCAPGNLTATAVSGSEIEIAWSGTASRYVLEGRKTPNDWDAVYDGSGTSFNHLGLACGSFWEYRVKSIAPDGGESGYSNTADATTNFCDIETPANLTADNSVPEQITLKWDSNSEHAIAFKVYRKEAEGAFVEIEDYVEVEQTTYVDEDVRCDTDYEYYVQAYDVHAVSDPSNIASTHSLYCGAGRRTAAMITVQAVMLDSEGEPFTGTAPLATAKLYGEKGADEPLFSETFTDVTVRNGLMRLPLGLTGNVVAVVRANEYLYYDILVDGQSLFDYEYQPLTASPYAIRDSYSLSGAGAPVGTSLDAPEGATYVDTQNKTLYVKTGSAPGDWTRVED